MRRAPKTISAVEEFQRNVLHLLPSIKNVPSPFSLALSDLFFLLHFLYTPLSFLFRIDEAAVVSSEGTKHTHREPFVKQLIGV